MNERFILGTVQFGLPYGINNTTGQPSKEKVFDILRLAYEQRIQELDSADAYGNAQEIIGAFFNTEKRSFKINTKFQVHGEKGISEQLDDTLLKLNLKHVNVYFFHRFSDLASSLEILTILEQLKQERRIMKTGVSIYTNEEFETCINNPVIDVIQIPFNLLDNDSKRGNLIKQAKQKGKTLQARSVFLQGLFFKDHQSLPQYLQPLSKYIRVLKELSNEYGLSMFDLALGYVIAKPEIDYIVLGVDSKDQLRKNLEAQKVIIPQELLDRINAIRVKEEALLYPYNWK